MAAITEPLKKRARKGFRYQLEFNFASEDAKQSFLCRMEKARRFLASRGSPPLDNREVICRLLDQLDLESQTTSQAECASTDEMHTHVSPMLEHSGL